MKVAVVGSGVAGLAATWLLNEYSDHEVHLYEADDRVGGHADTVLFERPGKEPVAVDRCFSVFNLSTYPNFTQFLRLCQIPMHGTAMSFSFSRDHGALEWSGRAAWALFCQPSNLFRPGMWRMVWDIIRFNALASRAVRKPREIGSMNLGEWLRRHSFSDEFINDYILPITASIWSTPPDTCALEFPAHTHFRFMHNHHFLQLTGKPPWMSIKGGSQLYVDRIISRVPADRIHLSTPIHSVSSSLDGGGKKLLTTASGETGEFDHVVLATHTDISLRILQNGTDGATELESKVLGGFTWAKNRVVVHHDDQLMPQRKSAWSCWNFITTSAGASTSTSTIDPVCLTYNMNQLQGIQSSKHGNVFVTLNPPPSLEPKEGTIVKDGVMEHPMFTADSTWAQENLHRIQNTRGVTFAGAWTKHGFHEDGFSSGLHVASKYIGIRRDAPPPFEIKLNHDRPIETGGERWADFVELLEFRRRAYVGTVSTIWTWQKQAVGLVWWALGVIIQMILVGVVISFAMVKKHLSGKDVDVPQDHQDGSLLESKNGNWPAKMGLPDVELKDHGE